MGSRAMIVVGGGSSRRFGEDKLMAAIAGQPLVVHTVKAVVATVDRCVLVCRADQMTSLRGMLPDVELTAGGLTRTESEHSGLSALGEQYQMIGIHDAARPLVNQEMIDRLFDAAESAGGAIPVLRPDQPHIERSTGQPLADAMVAQTPQVFHSHALRHALEEAAAEGYQGHDTAEVVLRYTETEIAAVPGDPQNIKVTYPPDLEMVRRRLEGDARTAPP